MDEVIEANEATGQNWFSQSTMDWFRSVIETPLIRGRYFVTSERDGDYPRRYTVRRVADDATIETVGEFQGYGTVASALLDVAALP